MRISMHTRLHNESHNLYISSTDTSNTRFIANKCREEVMLLKLKFIYKILLHITKVSSKFIFLYKSHEYLLYVLRDLCLHRLWKSNPNMKQSNFIMVKYVSRLLDQVNVGHIIHCDQSFKVFPGSREYLINTGVTFKYSNTITM